jgi:hypothetical protein
VLSYLISEALLSPITYGRSCAFASRPTHFFPPQLPSQRTQVATRTVISSRSLGSITRRLQFDVAVAPSAAIMLQAWLWASVLTQCNGLALTDLKRNLTSHYLGSLIAVESEPYPSSQPSTSATIRRSNPFATSSNDETTKWYCTKAVKPS